MATTEFSVVHHWNIGLQILFALIFKKEITEKVTEVVILVSLNFLFILMFKAHFACLLRVEELQI